MKTSTARRYAVILVLLVLSHEFCVALRYPAVHANQLVQDKRTEKREVKDEVRSNQVKIRQKRSYAVVLLAITLTSSVATVGFEIWLKHSGCCKLHSNFQKACDRAKIIPKLRESWKKKTKEVDDIFLAVQNLREDIIQHTFKLQEMYIDLESISRNYQLLVDGISPGTHKKFQIKWAEIERELQKGNRTVAEWTFEQLDMQFKSYFDSDPKTAFFGMSTFLTNLFSAVYSVSQAYYRRSYQNKMIAQLSTGQNRLRLQAASQSKAGRITGLTDVGIQQYVKDTAKSKTNAKFGMSSKYASLYHAYNVIGTLWSLGSDAYRVYQNVKQCQDKANQINKQYSYWESADKEMDQVKARATSYFNELNVAWKNVQGNLSEPNLNKTLTNAQEILQQGSTPRLQSASIKIGHYLTSIKTELETNRSKALETERDMIYGLMTLKLLVFCYNRNVDLIGFVSQECSYGAGSLSNLYTKAKPSFQVVQGNCLEVGVGEVTLADMEKAIVVKAQQEKFNPDCILNNKQVQQQVCSDKNHGYDAVQIAARRGLSDKNAQYLMSICPPPKVDANTKGMVCKLRSAGLSSSFIYDFFAHIYSQASLDAVVC